MKTDEISRLLVYALDDVDLAARWSWSASSYGPERGPSPASRRYMLDINDDEGVGIGPFGGDAN
jgi:hypothetical protein